MMDIEQLKSFLDQIIKSTVEWSTSPDFYAQCGLILTAVILSYSVSQFIIKHIPILRDEPRQGVYLYSFRKKIYEINDLVFPLFNIIFLGIAVELSSTLEVHSWLIRVAQSLAVVFMIYSAIKDFIGNLFLRKVINIIAIPIAFCVHSFL